MPDAVIRDCRADDMPAIAAIYGDWVTHGLASFELDPPGPTDMACRWAAIRDAGFPYLVAEDDGRVSGYV